MPGQIFLDWRTGQRGPIPRRIGCDRQDFGPRQEAARRTQLWTSLPTAGIALWEARSLDFRICSLGVGGELQGCGLPSHQIRRTERGSPRRTLWAHRMLTPLANAGLRPEPHQPRSLLLALWVGGGALVLGVVACLLSVICVHHQLEALRGELSQLREEMHFHGHRDVGLLQTPQFQGARDLLESWALQDKPPPFRERRKRDLKKKPRESTGPRRKHSVLHLIPVRQSSSSDGEITEIWWETFLHQGRALELSGRDVIVKHTGLYFIYSQVLFHDHTFTMGQELRRLGPEGQDQTLFRCIQSMPSDLEQAYNSCYSGGIFHLHKGDRVNLRIPRFNASFIISPHGTFLGLLRL